MSLLARLEQFRLKTHFKHIVLKLQLADTSHLSYSQRKNREHQIKVLESYGKNGVFPKNTNHPGQMVPYFRDTYGTLCAVGYLMWESGERTLVNDIVNSNNHIKVMEISGGKALEWMNENGLSQEECAEIQPGYTHYVYSISVCDLSDYLSLIQKGVAMHFFLIFSIIVLITVNIILYQKLKGKKALSLLQAFFLVCILLVITIIFFNTNDSWAVTSKENFGIVSTYREVCGLYVSYGLSGVRSLTHYGEEIVDKGAFILKALAVLLLISGTWLSISVFQKNKSLNLPQK